MRRGRPLAPPPNVIVIPLACPLRACRPPATVMAFGCHHRGGGVADGRRVVSSSLLDGPRAVDRWHWRCGTGGPSPPPRSCHLPGAAVVFDRRLSSNFATEVTSPKARCFCGFQIAVENIHSETYSLLIDTYIKDSAKKEHLLREIETEPCVQRKAQWALKWCNAISASFAERMIAFDAAKGIFFLGSFCAICWLKKCSTVTLRVCYTRNLSTGFWNPKSLRSSAVHLQLRWTLSLMPSLSN